MIATNEDPQTLSDLDGFDEWMAEVMAALARRPVEGEEERRAARASARRGNGALAVGL